MYHELCMRGDDDSVPCHRDHRSDRRRKRIDLHNDLRAVRPESGMDSQPLKDLAPRARKTQPYFRGIDRGKLLNELSSRNSPRPDIPIDADLRDWRSAIVHSVLDVVPVLSPVRAGHGGTRTAKSFRHGTSSGFLSSGTCVPRGSWHRRLRTWRSRK